MTQPEALSGGNPQNESPMSLEKKESDSMKSQNPSSQSQDLESQKEQSSESPTEPEAPARQIRGIKVHHRPLTNHQASKSYGVFNLKWLYIATVALFEIGSAICGAAPNMNVMIVGRAIA
ncbi:MAG: hypothetical protein Q9195_006460 [Heterodermia aff. obscurata]